MRQAIQPGDVKQRILTDEGAIEFSAIILSHVIDDLTYAENGVVFPRNEDKSLENYSAIRFMQTLFVKELMII